MQSMEDTYPILSHQIIIYLDSTYSIYVSRFHLLHTHLLFCVMYMYEVQEDVVVYEYESDCRLCIQ